MHIRDVLFRSLPTFFHAVHAEQAHIESADLLKLNAAVLLCVENCISMKASCLQGLYLPGLLSTPVPVVLKADGSGLLVVRLAEWSISLMCVIGCGAPVPVLADRGSLLVVSSFGCLGASPT